MPQLLPHIHLRVMVGTGGIEPPTPSVSGKCSPTELRACIEPRGFM